MGSNELEVSTTNISKVLASCYFLSNGDFLSRISLHKTTLKKLAKKSQTFKGCKYNQQTINNQQMLQYSITSTNVKVEKNQHLGFGICIQFKISLVFS